LLSHKLLGRVTKGVEILVVDTTLNPEAIGFYSSNLVRLTAQLFRHPVAQCKNKNRNKKENQRQCSTRSTCFQIKWEQQRLWSNTKHLAESGIRTVLQYHHSLTTAKSERVAIN